MMGIGVYAVIVMTLAAWCLARPSVILSMIFLLFALDQWGFALASGYLPGAAFTNYLAAGMTAMAIAILFMFGKPHRFLGGPAFWLVIALFSYALLSTYWVTVPDKAMGIWAVNFQYLVVFILGAPLLIQEVDDLEVPMRALLLLGTPFIFCLTFMLDWGYRGFYVNGELVRLPLALAQFGGYMMIVGALFGPKHSFWVVLRIAAVVLGALLIVKTGARGQFISAVLCGAVLFGLGRSSFSPIKLVIATVFASVFVVIAYIGAINYMKSDPNLQATAGRWAFDRLTEDYGGRSIRVLRIEAMLDAWKESPGTMLVGLGNSASYDPNITECTSPVGCYPHNLWIEILTEEGLIGFSLYLALVLYVGIFAVRAISDPSVDPDRKGALKVLFAFMIFELILSLKQGSLLGNWRFFLFAILLDRSINLLYKPVEVIDRATAPSEVREKTRAWLARRKPNGGFGRKPLL
ncbi:MAG: O-antigen ligase family protein [Geminicoccaceae bacterium]